MIKKLVKNVDGRYSRSITGTDGKRHYFHGYTQSEVELQIQKFLASEELGRFFSTVADEWWSDTSERIAVQSYRNYKRGYDEARSAFGTMPVGTITPRDVAAYLRRFQEQGYAYKTIANYKMVLSSILTRAIFEGDIDVNPCAVVKLPNGLPKKKRPAASLSDEEKILAAKGDCLLYYIAIMTGLRKGEILALRRKCFHFDRHVITIDASVAHAGDRPVVKGTKSEAGTREVPLLPALADVLLPLSAGADENDYLFSADGGKTPLTNRRFLTMTRHLSEKFGLTSTLHQLRHTYASIAVQSGVEPKVLQSIMGHRQISTTLDIYAEVRREGLDKAMDAFASSPLGRR